MKKKKSDRTASQVNKTNSITWRRTAKEAKKSVVIVRGLLVTVVALVMIVAVTYAISYFWDRLGSFTIKLNKYDMARQGITLSESNNIKNPTSRLNADIVKDMYNIAEEDLPKDLDEHDGSHNGDNYIAYTFYLANSGSDTVSVAYTLDMMNIKKNIDAAIRIRIYEDGKYINYAKPKSNGEAEANTTKFPSATVAASGMIKKFAPGDKKKYTVVIWLEGNDPDCVDDIVGGEIKFEMNYSISETS